MKKMLLLAGLAGMVAANAEAVDMTPYVGMDAGYSMVDYNDYYYLSSRNLSLSAVLGARTDHFGVEAFYMNSLRQHKADAATRISGYGVDLLGFQQLGCSGRWELVGSAGLAQYKIKANYPEGGTSDTGYGYRLGGGLQYALTENLSARVMYHHTWMNKSTIDSMDEFTVGIRYAF
ncbi:MAG: porin family protein [Acetobacter sp.]|nr:porin family protein [Acetobacter sp.]